MAYVADMTTRVAPTQAGLSVKDVEAASSNVCAPASLTTAETVDGFQASEFLKRTFTDAEALAGLSRGDFIACLKDPKLLAARTGVSLGKARSIVNSAAARRALGDSSRAMATSGAASRGTDGDSIPAGKMTFAAPAVAEELQLSDAQRAALVPGARRLAAEATVMARGEDIAIVLQGAYMTYLQNQDANGILASVRAGSPDAFDGVSDQDLAVMLSTAALSVSPSPAKETVVQYSVVGAADMGAILAEQTDVTAPDLAQSQKTLEAARILTAAVEHAQVSATTGGEADIAARVAARRQQAAARIEELAKSGTFSADVVIKANKKRTAQAHWLDIFERNPSPEAPGLYRGHRLYQAVSVAMAAVDEARGHSEHTTRQMAARADDFMQSRARVLDRWARANLDVTQFYRLVAHAVREYAENETAMLEARRSGDYVGRMASATVSALA